MGRILLVAAAALLFVTAIIHGCGQPMVDQWLEGLSHKQKLAMCLVWVTDSLAWAIVAILWALAAWRPTAGHLTTGAIAAAIPALTGAAIVAIDPAFFGGWLLMISVALAAVGLAIASRRQSNA